MTTLWFAATPGQITEHGNETDAANWCAVNGGVNDRAVWWAVTWPFVEPRVGMTREDDAA